eukprot:GILK01008782.1.p1 GENE.GILK01008782.1~~GILK01008782.1.p1  ORF type:complete len:505 (+),score=91.76 GILK01008782.1:157-1671(+)
MSSPSLDANNNAESHRRDDMKKYWTKYSKDGTIEEMLLDADATLLHAAEKNEILQVVERYAPPAGYGQVLELGAGIGRYTSELAKRSSALMAVDFMPVFVEKNKESNKNFKNIAWTCADVMTLEFAAATYDIIFSNWLLMYLDDEQVQILAERLMKALKPGGLLFFRESMFQPTQVREFNPTHYRHPSWYIRTFSQLDDEGRNLSLLTQRTIGAYVDIKGYKNQVMFVWKKDVASSSVNEFQRFLDTQQYSIKSILRYEKIFGPNFVSTGGVDTTREFVSRLNLQRGQRVLDIGSGIGGGAFFMSETYGVSVVGIDLSTNMFNIAVERAAALPSSCKVRFEVADCTTVEFEDESFDVIYTRDTLLHVADKLSLFKKCYKWLKPGGQLFISDYGQGSANLSEEFLAYVAQRGYHLLSPEGYGAVVQQAGFETVTAEDRTAQFIDILEREAAHLERNKETFLSEFSQADYDALMEGWQAKMVRCRAGNQKWVLVHAHKAGEVPASD